MAGNQTKSGQTVLRRVWLALAALTLTSTLIAETAHHSAYSVIIIFAIAALKAELVLTNYMEARKAEPHWIWMYRGWIAVVTVMLIAGYLV